MIVMIPLLWAWLAGNSLSQMMSLGVLLGVAGGSFAVALPLASRWYPPEHQGLAMGIAGAGNSGTILATLFAPRLAQSLGWRSVFGIAMIPICLVWTLFFLLASVVTKFWMLKYGLAVILTFVGAKMLLESWIHIPILLGGSFALAT